LKIPFIGNERTDRVSTWEEITLASAAASTPGTERDSSSSFAEPVLISTEVLKDLSDDELLYLLSLVDPDHRLIH
jgi:hypothetical protein